MKRFFWRYIVKFIEIVLLVLILLDMTERMFPTWFATTLVVFYGVTAYADGLMERPRLRA